MDSSDPGPEPSATPQPPPEPAAGEPPPAEPDAVPPERRVLLEVREIAGPDEPPEPEPDAVPPAPPEYRLFAPYDVALATALGGPIAGGVVLASNYRALGNARAACLSVLGGVLV